MELTGQEQQVLVNIILNGRYTPAEWEDVVKPIVSKLQGGKPDGNTV